jgi:hypothetical protein
MPDVNPPLPGEADAVRTPFPCWLCGGETVKIWRTATRYCGSCEVLELRHKTPYTPWVRIETVTPDGDPYVDHSVTHLPSPG